MGEKKAIQLGSIIPHVSCLGTISEHTFGPMEMNVSFVINSDHNLEFLWNKENLITYLSLGKSRPFNEIFSFVDVLPV